MEKRDGGRCFPPQHDQNREDFGSGEGGGVGQQGGEKSERGGRWVCVPKQLNSVQNTIVAGAGEAELEQLQHEERRVEVGLSEVSLHEEEEMRQDGLLRGDGETVNCSTPRVEVVRHIRALELREGENAILVDACGT